MVQGTITKTVNIAITATCFHLLPRSNNNSARIGSGVSSAGLTRATKPQVAPHAIQWASGLDEPSLLGRNSSADNAVSHRMYGKIAMYGEAAHIHPADKPALSP